MSYNAKRAILRTEFQEHTEEAGGVCTDGRNQIWVCSGKNAANAENGHGKMTLLTDAPEEILRQDLEVGDDGRTVALKKGAKAGRYVISVTVSGGEEDTYTNIEGESFTVEVK